MSAPTGAGQATILASMLDAFSDLHAKLSALDFDARRLSPKLLAESCSTVIPLFNALGFALKFAGDDFKSKVNTVRTISETHSTILSYIETDQVKLGWLRV